MGKIKLTEEQKRLRLNKMMNERYQSNPKARQDQIRYTKEWIKNNREEFNSYQRDYKSRNPEKAAKWSLSAKANIRKKFIEGFFDNQLDEINEEKLFLIFISEDELEVRLMQVVDNFQGDLNKFKTKIKYLSSKKLDGFGLYGVYRLIGDFKESFRYIKEKNHDCKIKSSLFGINGFQFEILEDDRLAIFEEEYFNVVE